MADILLLIFPSNIEKILEAWILNYAITNDNILNDQSDTETWDPQYKNIVGAIDGYDIWHQNLLHLFVEI